MARQALYRKYRSDNFTQVIGQDQVVKTLTNALASGHLSHAYLFTGPRGVGKTSVARLLARALNCTGDIKPCNQCPNCLAAINSSLDIIEMDAASNRSIDSIRDMREKVGLAPTQGRYKVYIIDEVHMLTTEAFNALLKTLEEPPAHAVFILATTEAHKIPETIISRTQRFNFKPHTQDNIASQLAVIAKAEDITVESEALALIAAIARGGLRDAIGMLDQLATGSTEAITAETVRSLLGYSPAEEITSLSEAIARADSGTALEVVSRLEANGAQPGQVTLQLIDQWRAVLHTAAHSPQVADEATTKLATQVSAARSAAIIEALLEITRSHWPQLALEAALVKLTAAAEPPAATVAPSQPPVVAQPPVNPSRSSAKTPAATVESRSAAAQSTSPMATSDTLSRELWPKVLMLLKTQSNPLSALLQMYPVEFEGDTITIKPRFNFHRDLFLKPANRTTIETAAHKVYGRSIKIVARTEDANPRSKRALPDPTAELVSSALEILGGEIVE